MNAIDFVFRHVNYCFTIYYLSFSELLKYFFRRLLDNRRAFSIRVGAGPTGFLTCTVVIFSTDNTTG